MAKPSKWVERFSCHHLPLFADLSVNVNWSTVRGRQYEVYALGQHLKNDFAELDEGKRAGLLAAQKIVATLEIRIAEALKELAKGERTE